MHPQKGKPRSDLAGELSPKEEDSGMREKETERWKATAGRGVGLAELIPRTARRRRRPAVSKAPRHTHLDLM